MNGFDWNGNGNRDTFDEYMDYETSNGGGGSGNGGSGGGGFGCGWIVIVIVAIMLLCFIFTGASWDAIDSLLGLGFLAFLFLRWIST